MKNPSQTKHKFAIARTRITRFLVGTTTVFSLILPGLMIGTISQPASAQAAKSWSHCSPNVGAVGPFFVIPPGFSKAGLNCTLIFFSEKEATNWACYRSGRGNGYWPQIKSFAAIRGLSSANFTCT